MNPVLFPILALIATALAYVAPDLFTPYRGAIVPLLVVIMFGMGLTLKLDDFRRVAARPVVVGLGVLLQYTVMPLAALGIGADTVIKIGPMPCKIGAEWHWFAKKPDEFGPEWQFRFFIVPVVPKPDFAKKPIFGSR